MNYNLMKFRIIILSLILFFSASIQPVSADSNVKDGSLTVPWLCIINYDLCNNIDRLENIEIEKNVIKNNISIVSWSPEIVTDVYVNDTVNETIEYSITTSEPLSINNWTIDDVPYPGTASSGTASFTHEWNSSQTGFHTIDYKGYNNRSEFGFKWYVSVYKTGDFVEGGIFNVIDDLLENDMADIKVRIFEYKFENDDTEFLEQEINHLSDANSGIMEKRENLKNELKANSISPEEYAATIKQIRKEENVHKKFMDNMVEVVKEKTNFEKISMQKDDHIDKGKEIDQGTEGKKETRENVKKENTENGKDKTGGIEGKKETRENVKKEDTEKGKDKIEGIEGKKETGENLKKENTENGKDKTGGTGGKKETGENLKKENIENGKDKTGGTEGKKETGENLKKDNTENGMDKTGGNGGKEETGENLKKDNTENGMDKTGGTEEKKETSKKI